VGGCVRDWLLGVPNKDYDIEVYGLGWDELVAALAPWGQPDLVGRSFGVVKLTTTAGNTYDFTLPRRDSKVASGHRGFEVTIDPSIHPREAAARRDFTINALAFDPREDVIIDFFGGQDDLRNRILRHTSEAFGEDPLRVLRGMQFAGRFNLRAAPETTTLCRQMSNSFRELAPERVREEWFKWAEKSVVPSAGLRFLEEAGWLEHFPEIHALRGTPQDPVWHPEGDVFTHTCHCCDAMATLSDWQAAEAESKIVYMMAMLAHDFAKPQTTHEVLRDGVMRIVSPGHEEQGGPLAESFLARINAPRAIVDRVVPLVVHHLAHLQQHSDRSVRRLAKKLEPENIGGLVLVMTADHMGRPPKPAVAPPSVLELRAKADELMLRENAPRPILQGRNLIERGLKPGKHFSAILDAAFEAQMEGQFGDLPQALAWLDRRGGAGGSDSAA
jgi:tRNA nucleotidyltransferase (CCA-adding enzyme)